MKRQVNANHDTPVIYIGNKPLKREKTYGTRLTFRPGQMHMVISSIAVNMLNHHDVYTTPGTDEYKQFVTDNPLAAAQEGLIDVSEEELKTLLEADAASKTPSAETDEDDAITVTPKGSDSPTGDIETVKAELKALVNKGQIAEWCDEKGLDVALSGTRAEQEDQALAAYEASRTGA